MMKTIWDVLKGPVITEKALKLKEKSTDSRQAGACISRRTGREQARDQAGGRDDLQGQGRRCADHQLPRQGSAPRPDTSDANRTGRRHTSRSRRASATLTTEIRSSTIALSEVRRWESRN